MRNLLAVASALVIGAFVVPSLAVAQPEGGGGVVAGVAHGGTTNTTAIEASDGRASGQDRADTGTTETRGPGCPDLDDG
jgi:hypothetical protein